MILFSLCVIFVGKVRINYIILISSKARGSISLQPTHSAKHVFTLSLRLQTNWSVCLAT